MSQPPKGPGAVTSGPPVPPSVQTDLTSLAGGASPARRTLRSSLGAGSSALASGAPSGGPELVPDASQVKAESQQSGKDPLYVNLKVKKQVRIDRLRALNLLPFMPLNTLQDGDVTHFRIKRTAALGKVNVHPPYNLLRPDPPYTAD